MSRPAKGTILMRHVYAGINASDVSTVSPFGQR
jgi:hypothetical protein